MPKAYTFVWTRPVIKAEIKMNRRLKSIPLRLWMIGPGASAKFTQSAPNEIVVPTCNSPKKERIKEGKRIAIVVRKPSANSCVKKKYLNSRNCFLICRALYYFLSEM